MAAMSIVICSKTAKVIFARQFVPMTRRELEEYVVQFSRGIDSCKDITHFESDKVRYLFIPIDTFFLILITSRTSNIIEDTEILKLIYRLVQDVCGAVDYESITKNAFELMMGVDDIVCLGYRSGANIAQVKQYMQMESLEEKEFKRRKLEQERKVQRDLNEKSKEFDKLRREKKFMTNAISSSNFVKDEPVTQQRHYEPVYKEEKREETNIKNEIAESDKGEKKQSKGLKLTKKKIYQ